MMTPRQSGISSLAEKYASENMQLLGIGYDFNLRDEGEMANLRAGRDRSAGTAHKPCGHQGSIPCVPTNLGSQHGGNVRPLEKPSASRVSWCEPPEGASAVRRSQSLQGNSEKSAGSNPAESTTLSSVVRETIGQRGESLKADEGEDATSMAASSCRGRDSSAAQFISDVPAITGPSRKTISEPKHLSDMLQEGNATVMPEKESCRQIHLRSMVVALEAGYRALEKR